MPERDYLGIVIQGSLSGGLEMRLDSDKSVEDLRVGRFVVVEGTHSRFFSMLTDVALSATTPNILLNPPSPKDGGDRFLMEVLAGVTTFGTVKLQPMLMLQKDDESDSPLRPVKTIPSHFSPVYEADASDFALVFGQEDESDPSNTHFNIGKPLNMDTQLQMLNL